jgi:hypothetical protein
MAKIEERQHNNDKDSNSNSSSSLDFLSQLDQSLSYSIEKDIGDFGYGIYYQKRPIAFLDNIKIKRMFIADMYQNFHLLEKLKNKDITIVVHDACEILKKMNIILRIGR